MIQVNTGNQEVGKVQDTYSSFFYPPLSIGFGVEGSETFNRGARSDDSNAYKTCFTAVIFEFLGVLVFKMMGDGTGGEVGGPLYRGLTEF